MSYLRGTREFLSMKTVTKKNKKRVRIRIEQGDDGYMISDVVELPGCHTQAKTCDELMKRTKEAIELYINAKKPKIQKFCFRQHESEGIVESIELMNDEKFMKSYAKAKEQVKKKDFVDWHAL
jgi:predicted RNase H-like HicB family nuclease